MPWSSTGQTSRYGQPCHEPRKRLLPRLRLNPNVEVDALAVDDVLTLADVRLHDDPVIKHQVALERNFARELNSHAPVREVET